MRLSAEQRVAIVGAGHSGGRVALHLRACGFKGEIVVIGEEPDLPYERPPLSKEYLLTNEGAPHAGLSSEIGWREVGVRLCLGTKAINLQPSRKRLHLSDGQVLDYDRVVLAMGAAPRELGIPGGNRGQVLLLRTL
ncbi:MAG TPA: FAD-dependent oxidoreductase, partial [Steroidobacteraceae bacterium]